MNFLKRIVKKVDRRVYQTVLSEREREKESVKFVRLNDIFQVFDHLVILSRPEEREDAAAYLSEG